MAIKEFWQAWKEKQKTKNRRSHRVKRNIQIGEASAKPYRSSVKELSQAPQQNVLSQRKEIQNARGHKEEFEDFELSDEEPSDVGIDLEQVKPRAKILSAKTLTRAQKEIRRNSPTLPKLTKAKIKKSDVELNNKYRLKLHERYGIIPDHF